MNLFYESVFAIDEVSPRYIRDPEDQEIMQRHADRLKKINKGHAPKAVKNMQKNNAEYSARRALYKSLDKKREESTGKSRDNYNRQITDLSHNELKGQANRGAIFPKTLMKNTDKDSYKDNSAYKSMTSKQKAYYDKKNNKRVGND